MSIAWRGFWKGIKGDLVTHTASTYPTTHPRSFRRFKALRQVSLPQVATFFPHPQRPSWCTLHAILEASHATDITTEICEPFINTWYTFHRIYRKIKALDCIFTGFVFRVFIKAYKIIFSGTVVIQKPTVLKQVRFRLPFCALVASSYKTSCYTYHSSKSDQNNLQAE